MRLIALTAVKTVHKSAKTLAFSLLVTTLSMFHASSGYSQVHFNWPDNEFEFKVNAQSFESLINHVDLDLTADQYLWWVTSSANVWKYRSLAGIDIRYSGTTSESCEDANLYTTSVIGAAQGTSSDTYGVMYPRFSVFPNLIKANVCIFAHPSIKWRVKLTGIASDEMDLAGVLVHEIGHALGLDHLPNSVIAVIT